VHEERAARLGLVVEVELDLALARDARREQPILFPRGLIRVELRPPR
jgi:hypothetical protein